MATTIVQEKKLTTVPLDWKEVYYTNCPLVSASNVDQELGWTKEQYKKIGIQYLYLRSRAENDWYPHYIHNLDNLIRFGGLFPPIHVHADIRRTRLLGVTHAPREGGVHAGALARRHLPDGRSERQEDWTLPEPEQDQDRLVGHSGRTGHRADASAERHDPQGRSDRGIPVSG